MRSSTYSGEDAWRGLATRLLAPPRLIQDRCIEAGALAPQTLGTCPRCRMPPRVRDQLSALEARLLGRLAQLGAGRGLAAKPLATTALLRRIENALAPSTWLLPAESPRLAYGRLRRRRKLRPARCSTQRGRPPLTARWMTSSGGRRRRMPAVSRRCARRRSLRCRQGPARFTQFPLQLAGGVGSSSSRAPSIARSREGDADGDDGGFVVLGNGRATFCYIFQKWF